MPVKQSQIDNGLMAGAGVLFVGLGAWMLFGGAANAGPPRLPEPTAAASYKPAALVNPQRDTEKWENPVVRESDGEWLFDVFTPPVIYYNVSTHEFTVTPPDSAPGEALPVDRPFGLELVEIKRTPYRIQLVGYVGSEGDYLATFEDVEGGGTFLAKVGRTVDEPGVMLRSFAVEKVRDQSGSGTVVHDIRATAVIRDLRQDKDVVLVQKERLMNEEPTAVFRITGDLPRVVDGRSGGTISSTDATFVIGNLTISPPSAEVTRMESTDRPTEVRRLEPAPLIQPGQGEDGFQFPPTENQANPFGSP